LTSQGLEALDRAEYAQAERLLQSALREAEKRGRQSIQVAASLNNLAVLYEARNELARAEGLYRQTLAIQEKLLGPTHPAVALGLGTLAALHWRRGQAAQAESLYRRALAAQERALGSMHPRLATTLDQLATVLRQTGRESEAAGLEARAQGIRTRYADDGSDP
jgi:tetratricopeptide (TPR) repeat protein